MSSEIDWAGVDEAVAALGDSHYEQFTREMEVRRRTRREHATRISGSSYQGGNRVHGVEEWVPGLSRYAPAGRIIDPLWAGEEIRYENLSGRRVPWSEPWYQAWRDYAVCLGADEYFTPEEQLTLHHARFH